MNNRTRANNFDRRCGVFQTKKVLELGMGGSVLDVGCGTGEFTSILKKRFNQVYGMDPDTNLIGEALKTTTDITYFVGFGETFTCPHRFNTINMTNLLEHVDDPIKLLANCRLHLAEGGRIVAQVPNSRSITRRLGALMGLIDSTANISDKERDFYGHKRTYTLRTLRKDFIRSGLKIIESGGILYKPLPNEILEELCVKNGSEWTNKFINALIRFGEDRPSECAYIYVCASL